ncbi:RNA polymerase III transcription factor III [Tubulinosema ratisbonensis]|uniref:RNA polymerase III transcription factor III n=1 Tax=Tubulinosema ratisbonensis TaxID=291195 RepID=A0A437ANY7_9MICR|nr:RNA polymerase III transcription factor III [Tubulinosema ratisbonensis]
MDNLKEYDLIEFPIDPDILEGLEFIKIEDTYVTFIEDLNIRKKIVSNKIEKKTLLIKIEDNVEIIGISNQAYVFDTPIDFVFPVEENVKIFYKKIVEIIEKEDTEELINLSNLLDKEILPFYPLPMLLSHEQGDISLLKEKKYLKIEPKNLSVGNDSEVEKFIIEIFEIHPILRKEFIKKEFYKRFGDKISTNRIRDYLNKHCNFINSGPFSKCWIKKGINEKDNSYFYIYQVFGKIRNHEELFQLFEKPFLVDKVEKNKTLYFSGVYDEKLGYLTKLAVIDFEHESEPENEFELFD